MGPDATYAVATGAAGQDQRPAAGGAALHRLAALAAEGATAPAVLAAIAGEAARASAVPAALVLRYRVDGTAGVAASTGAAGFPVDGRPPLDGPSVAATIRDTGRAARIDDHGELPGAIAAAARASGIRAMAGVPLTVGGVLWGALCAGGTDRVQLPGDAEERLADLAEAAAAALAAAETRDRLRRLAGDQAAVRRVATLVAEGVPPAELFATVTEEVVRALGARGGWLHRYDPDRSISALAAVNNPGFPVGSRAPLDGPGVAATVLETGLPARVDDFSRLPGSVARRARASGFRSACGVPIIVDGAIWGVIGVGGTDADPVPENAQERLRDFTDIVAIAISNAESRERPRRLAEEQAALRRVATLVAEGAKPAVVFAAVAEEVARILDVTSVVIARYDAGEAVVVASMKAAGFPVRSRWPVDGPSLFATVLQTRRPARIADYAHLPGAVAEAVRASGTQAALAVPIVVDGRVWGVITVARRVRRDPMPVFAGSYTGRLVLATESAEDTEARLTAFTELAATAISKADANDELRQLAEEQAALRRVATLVAEAVPPDEIFAAVVDEVGTILGLQGIELVRYEGDGTAMVIGASGDHPFPPGSGWTLEAPSVMARVFRTNRPARVDDYSALPGAIAEIARSSGFRSAIGAPIVVDGRTWGAMVAFSMLPQRISERTEIRLSQFTELVATAVSNATARDELVASRVRLVAAGDEARRRIERNLHDGTQQRLLALGLDLRGIRATVPDGQRAAHAALDRAQQDLEATLAEVRELSRGLHPAQLARGGLSVALRGLARRSQIPVDLDVDVGERPPPAIEIAVYYVVSEALTNAVKHSGASAVSVTVQADRAVVRASIADDGAGGAVAGEGSGLTGLRDRVEALGGRLALDSPPGRGTVISIELPIAAPARP
jgi:signal transduction histidine kinase